MFKKGDKKKGSEAITTEQNTASGVKEKKALSKVQEMEQKKAAKEEKIRLKAEKAKKKEEEKIEKAKKKGKELKTKSKEAEQEIKEYNRETKNIHSIRFKIAIIMVFSIILAVIVNFYYLISMSKNTMISTTEASLQDIASAQGSYIDQSIEKYNATMTYLSNSENFTVYQLNDGTKFANEVNSALTKYMEKNSSHESISFVGIDKKTVMASTEPTLVGEDYSQKEFVKYILDNNAPAQSNVFFNTAGDPVISIGVPQRTHVSNDQLAGVVFTNIKASLLSDMVAGIKIDNMDSSYACLLDSNGVYIYHPNIFNIGKKTTDKVLLDVVDKIGNDETLETSVTLNNETNEYLAYNVSPMNHWILAISVSQGDVLKPFTQMGVKALSVSLVLIIILSIVGYLFAATIIAPLKKITKLVHKTSKLDLRADDKYNSLMKKKDETGEMGRAVEKMRISFHDMMQKLTEISKSINENADHLNEIANVVNDHANENFATAEELSAGMEETSASTDVISSDIAKIESYTSAINERATQGVNLSEEIMKRTVEMKTNTAVASESTRKMYNEVRNETEEAIERSKTVSRINDLANAIKEIAEQTGLLSLNASIEAARAGEAGRGFAVVASEIGKLADQSSQTVGSITSIVSEVTEAVNDMTQSLTKTLNFLETKVLKDYDGFIQISEQYSGDASNINQTMTEIDNSIDELNESMLKISTAIAGINDSVAESTKGVTDVAVNNSEIVKLTKDTYKMAQETISNAEQLNGIVDQFVLDNK